jgi:hypothetical protein
LQLPHWRKPLSKTPAIAHSSTRTQIAKTRGPVIPTPTAVTGGTTGGTATHPWNVACNVTMSRTADKGMEMEAAWQPLPVAKRRSIAFKARCKSSM